MNEKILIAHNELGTAKSIAAALHAEGFQATTANDGAKGLSMVRESAPDVLLLDVVLPTMGGFDICRILRSESNIPIIMVTSKSEEFDRVIGLELGADDYITEPFGMRELIARIKAVIRRSRMSPDIVKQEVIKAGDLTVDCGKRMVFIRKREARLPFKQFELLRLLAKNRDRVLSREVLLGNIWADDDYEQTKTLDVHIRWIREKIEDDPSDPKRLMTVRGVGYMLVSHIKE